MNDDISSICDSQTNTIIFKTVFENVDVQNSKKKILLC